MWRNRKHKEEVIYRVEGVIINLFRFNTIDNP